MALLFMDSFDHYALADVGQKYGSATIQSLGADGRRGSKAFGMFSGAFVWTRVFTPASTTVVVGVAHKSTAFQATATPFLKLYAGLTVQVSLCLHQPVSTGVLTAYRGDVATLLGTASAPFPTNAYSFIELKVVVHPSAGSLIVRQDGVVVLTLSGINTAASGTAAWDSVRLSVSKDNGYFDDFYVLDGSGAAPLNDFLGDCRVDALYPTTQGATHAWTPSTGSDNALTVDETAPNGDTDYNSTSTVGATDTHVVQDAPVPGAVLYGVQVCLNEKKTTTGTCSVAPVVRHSGVDYPGTAVAIGTNYAYDVTPYSTNPGTGAAWTEAGFNAAEFGYKRTA
jgi:hypothetical protein